MNGINVLLVDDEAEFTASMKRVLTRRGFSVKVAGDGLTALPMIAGEHFDVVVLDLKMPGMDGVRVLEEIKRFSPDMPVILLTGYFSLSEEKSALTADAYAYLIKPYPILQLVDLIVAAASDNPNTCPRLSTRVEGT